MVIKIVKGGKQNIFDTIAEFSDIKYQERNSKRKNNTYPIFPVYSQIISSYPVFSVKPSKDFRLFIYLKQIFWDFQDHKTLQLR